MISKMEEKTKNILKSLKMNESTISMVLGLAVVVIVGGLIVNYFRTKPAELPEITDQELAQVDEAEQEEFAEIPAKELPPFKGDLPTTYKVRSGDDLWKIAERFYQTGYGWTEIAEANELTNPGIIEKDQELQIPQLAKAYPPTVEDVEPAIGGASSTSIMEEEQKYEKVPEESEESVETESQVENKITGESYTVVKGDHLWGIAERAYNDGYKWVDIANANNLDNPSIIPVGLELNIPR